MPTLNAITLPSLPRPSLLRLLSMTLDYETAAAADGDRFGALYWRVLAEDVERFLHVSIPPRCDSDDPGGVGVCRHYLVSIPPRCDSDPNSRAR